MYLNPSIPFLALSSTAVIFGTFSLSVLLTPSPQFFYLGGLLGSTVSVLGWLSLVNLFVGSSTLFSIELYLGLMAFAMFVIYDTQVMIRKVRSYSLNSQ